MKTIKKNKKLNSVLAFVIAVIVIPSISIAVFEWHTNKEKHQFEFGASTPGTSIKVEHVHLTGGKITPDQVSVLHEGEVHEIVKTVKVTNNSAETVKLVMNKEEMLNSIEIESEGIAGATRILIVNLLKNALDVKHYYKQDDQWKEYDEKKQPEIKAKGTMEVQHKVKLLADVLGKDENANATAKYKDKELTPSKIKITVFYEVVK